MRLSPGSRKQITTKLTRGKDLVMNVTSSDPTATLQVYVKVGKVYANAATYDALITLEEVSVFFFFFILFYFFLFTKRTQSNEYIYYKNIG